jgi:outer membrane protein
MSEHPRKNKAPSPRPARRRGALVARIGRVALIAGLWWSAATEAHAIQPLTEFLDAARRDGVDARLAAARREQVDRERGQSKLGLAPTLAVDAGYTFNQYEAIARLPNPADPTAPPREAVITPRNQLDATVRLSQPLVDVGRWMALSSAKARSELERASEEETLAELQREVARAYYQVIAASAVVEATARAFTSAEENLRIVQARAAAQLASDLDIKRATAEVELVRQTEADADYQLAIARRSLRTVSGLEPADGSVALDAGLQPEGELASWEQRATGESASVARANARAESVEADLEQAKGVFYPTVSAFAQERFTNAVGFAGRNAIGSLGVSLTWRLDLAAIPAVRARKGGVRVARLEAEKVELAAKDEVHRQWQAVRAGIVKAKAARAQVDAASSATTRAKQRYEAGAALLLDVIQSERDQLDAEVRRIQADADLELARVLLRISVGEEPRVGATAPSSPLALDETRSTSAPARPAAPGSSP